MSKELAKGKVVRAFGNLLHVKFEGDIRQGEVAMVHIGDLSLKSEVIEVVGDEVKLQVFEDISGIQLDSPVEFSSHLLEAELGPGLISAIFDGLQNPLERVAEASGLLLKRGTYIPSLDRTKHWEYQPVAKIGDLLTSGDTIGTTMEGRFHHRIMLPFAMHGKFTLSWVAEAGSYTIEEEIAKVKNEKGEEISLTMMQKWPIKAPLIVGKKNQSNRDDGDRSAHHRYPISNC